MPLEVITSEVFLPNMTALLYNQCFRFFPISFRCALGMPIANWCRTLCLLGFGGFKCSKNCIALSPFRDCSKEDSLQNRGEEEGRFKPSPHTGFLGKTVPAATIYHSYSMLCTATAISYTLISFQFAGFDTFTYVFTFVVLCSLAFPRFAATYHTQHTDLSTSGRASNLLLEPEGIAGVRSLSILTKGPPFIAPPLSPCGPVVRSTRRIVVLRGGSRPGHHDGDLLQLHVERIVVLAHKISPEPLPGRLVTSWTPHTRGPRHRTGQRTRVTTYVEPVLAILCHSAL